jgi:hypothetical protein
MEYHLYIFLVLWLMIHKLIVSYYYRHYDQQQPYLHCC